MVWSNASKISVTGKKLVLAIAYAERYQHDKVRPAADSCSNLQQAAELHQRREAAYNTFDIEQLLLW